MAVIIRTQVLNGMGDEGCHNILTSPLAIVIPETIEHTNNDSPVPIPLFGTSFKAMTGPRMLALRTLGGGRNTLWGLRLYELPPNLFDEHRAAPSLQVLPT